MTTQSIGQYRIVRQLGEGGMGVVYEGINDSLQKRVAIKVLHAEFSQNAQVRQRFFNEARAVNMVQHPGLVSVLEVGQNSDGCMYLVMEFLAGESLRSRLQRHQGPLPMRMAVRILRQIALALAAAHQLRIVHRDLKPDNIMIVKDSDVPGGERAKLLDFGIAKIIDDSPPIENGMRTRTGMMMGTPAYMAPEQCRGAGAVDEKADAYSLGVMAFEMLCGQKPFSGTGPGELIARHLFEPPPALQSLAPSVPRSVANLVHRLLAKQPAERPTMIQFAQELDALRLSEEALPIPALPSPSSRDTAAKSAVRSGSSPNRTLPLSLATLGDATAQREGRPVSPHRYRAWIGGSIGALTLVGLTLGIMGIRKPEGLSKPQVTKAPAVSGVAVVQPTQQAAAVGPDDKPATGPTLTAAATTDAKLLPGSTIWEVTSYYRAS